MPRDDHSPAPFPGKGPAGLASTLAPGLAARVICRLFVTAQRYKMPARETAWMQDARSQTLTIADGRRIRLYHWGTGPRVLLVHGMSAQASQMAVYAHPLVQAGWSVTAFDAPGHGASDGKTAALPDIARVQMQVMDHLGPLAGVIAHSVGSAATSLALLSGAQAGRIVYLAPPEDLFGFMARMARHLGFSDAATQRAKTRFETQHALTFDQARGAHVVPQLGHPALILHDEDDRMVPIREGARIAQLWPGARLIRTKGLGHNRLVRDPQVMQQAVGFLTQQD